MADSMKGMDGATIKWGMVISSVHFVTVDWYVVENAASRVTMNTRHRLPQNWVLLCPTS